MESLTYRIIIEPDENNTFHAYAPALQGCHTWGETIEETRQNIRDAIDVYIRSLKADGLPIPEDRGIEIVETFNIEINKKKSLANA